MSDKTRKIPIDKISSNDSKRVNLFRDLTLNTSDKEALVRIVDNLTSYGVLSKREQEDRLEVIEDLQAVLKEAEDDARKSLEKYGQDVKPDESSLDDTNIMKDSETGWENLRGSFVDGS